MRHLTKNRFGFFELVRYNKSIVFIDKTSEAIIVSNEYPIKNKFVTHIYASSG